MVDPSVTDWIGAIAASTTTVVAVAAVLYARSQLHEAARVRRQTADLEVERSQPYVEVFLEQDAANPALVDLVVKNFGQTAAKDVRLSLEPWPRRAAVSNVADPVWKVVAVPALPSLAPGQEWRTFFDDGTERTQTELPARHEGQVEYEGLAGRVLTTPVVLDLSVYDEQVYTARTTLRQVSQAIESLGKALKR